MAARREKKGWSTGYILLAPSTSVLLPAWCLRGVSTQAPPPGWVVTLGSSDVDRIPNWVGDVGTLGDVGAAGGSVSRLGENGEPSAHTDAPTRSL